jgi:hypothetical protein
MLQKQAVPKKLLGLLEQLQQIPALDEFVLAGGTSKTVRLIQEKGLDFDAMKKKLLKSVRQYDSLQQDNDRGR